MNVSDESVVEVWFMVEIAAGSTRRRQLPETTLNKHTESFYISLVDPRFHVKAMHLREEWESGLRNENARRVGRGVLWYSIVCTFFPLASLYFISDTSLLVLFIYQSRRYRAWDTFCAAAL